MCRAVPAVAPSQRGRLCRTLVPINNERGTIGSAANPIFDVAEGKRRRHRGSLCKEHSDTRDNLQFAISGTARRVVVHFAISVIHGSPPAFVSIALSVVCSIDSATNLTCPSQKTSDAPNGCGLPM